MRKFLYALSLALTMAFVWTGCSDGKETIPTKFTVTFNSNGGSLVSSMEINEGAKIAKPTDPTKENFIFVYWFKESSFTTPWNFNTDVVTKATTLYAKWATVSMESLEELVLQANDVDPSNYTTASYSAMLTKKSAAELVLSNETSTPAQILAAYKELQTAINALVAIPYRGVTSIFIDSRSVDGIYYVTPGDHFYFYAEAADASGSPATDNRVTFTYNVAALTAWADGAIYVQDTQLSFNAKSPLTAGQTITVTIKSVAKPAISKTITLKVPAVGALKTQFLAAVNALPAPGSISYEHIPAINKLYALYEKLTWEERTEAAVEVAHEKMMELEYAVEKLPIRMDFKFVGNVCTFTNVDFYIDGGKGDESDRTTVTTYVADGSFPQGTYTTMWEHDYADYYYQNRIILKNGVFTMQERIANNPNGTGATAWEQVAKSEDGTYTFTGTQAAGGRLIVTWTSNETEAPGPAPVSSSAKMSNGVAKSAPRIFKR